LAAFELFCAHRAMISIVAPATLWLHFWTPTPLISSAIVHFSPLRLSACHQKIPPINQSMPGPECATALTSEYSFISLLQRHAAFSFSPPDELAFVTAFRYENPEPEPAAPEPVADPKAKKK
jgi:hypothetical protein